MGEVAQDVSHLAGNTLFGGSMTMFTLEAWVAVATIAYFLVATALLLRKHYYFKPRKKNNEP